MTRPEQLLYEQREPAPTRPAATMLLVRDAPTADGVPGIEVLMTRRSMHASFAPGVFVFPGGAVDPADALALDVATRRETQTDAHAVLAFASIRETFEELGVLLARRADGSAVNSVDIAALDRKAPFAEQCRQCGLRPAVDNVFMLAHWITDRDLPRRFDVSFFVARMPPHQTPDADETEQFEPVWVRPVDALTRHAAGNFAMIFPTIRTLERLREFESADTLLAACSTEIPQWTSCPRGGLLAGAQVRFMEHDAPFGELALVCPDGQMRHSLDWQSLALVPLLKNVKRLTAPNGGMMTGPGTNSYVVGDVGTGFIVIDPGPADDQHIRRLYEATGGEIRMIVCTHSHADHSPAARLLQALCAGAPPVLGLPSGPLAGSSSYFAPDRTLRDREILALTADDTTHRLIVVYTPGHASNHVCLLLMEDGLLFSGDHILNGSTTIIDPPDGNMTAYLESLDQLDMLCNQHGVEFVLPAHGHVLGSARAQIARIKTHRLEREAKIAAVVRNLPRGTLDEWVERAYDDVPRKLWPAATRSLLAHLARIEAREHLGLPGIFC
ncbi:glyoxylase-like metal-dependent hydrolase (beta-lactamase superfamily II) [Paraburkholderia sp. RAU2J]|uniref:MBL fold metallo-hydrolase n=1 Tax=Paraburkholderia sp. RAU2J TaxID=1938810 RepID=UPI000EAD27B8|nr:MBL fold metallo-hydrolase [Paraburkholderia sp. RAU2J]RKT14145.1 glyoxylase-like metal-dependent hydrolase (beta-lactamase superfamily II) [Paraburkholderia sp. RAU2J]